MIKKINNKNIKNKKNNLRELWNNISTFNEKTEKIRSEWQIIIANHWNAIEKFLIHPIIGKSIIKNY